MSQQPVVCFVCTGNAARSVMARAMYAQQIPEAQPLSAGTLVLEGQPMSLRTRQALRDLGLDDPAHLSVQFDERHVHADLMVVMEPGHIAWMRRHFPEAASRTASLPRLVRHLQSGQNLADQLAALSLADVEVEPWEEVIDPAGGDQEAFHRCAEELNELVGQLAKRLRR